MPIREVETKFYTFSQNNSGGGWDHDKDKGIGHFVIVEATSSSHAEKRAEEIGLYFNGVDDGIDCECCGDRWYGSDDGKSVPSIYDTDVSNLKYESSYSWGVPSYIHYMSGEIKEVEEVTKPREIKSSKRKNLK